MSHRRLVASNDLTLAKKREVTEWAKVRCDRWWVDILDCSKSWCRQLVEMPFEDVMGYLTDEAHFTVIHRCLHPENYIEVGFRADKEEGVDIFLWVILDPKWMDELTTLVQCLKEKVTP